MYLNLSSPRQTHSQQFKARKYGGQDDCSIHLVHKNMEEISRRPVADRCLGNVANGTGAVRSAVGTSFDVRLRLHVDCRWPHDVGDSERQTWSSGELLVTVDQGWSIRRLSKEAEALIGDEHGIRFTTALVLSPSRDAAMPFYDRVDSLEPEEVLELVGDLERDERRHASGRGTSEVPTAAQKVPVTILTGFLGAGKTTMLNHLLHVQREKRIAVIENEFGEVPIDGELLADGDGLSAAEQVVVLDNGCMCCSVRGDLLGAFASVLKKMEEAGVSRKNGEGRPLDSVLVETTGMADPVPIVRTLLQTPAIANSFALDGVVTLVDAKNVLPRLREGEDADESTEGEVDEAFQQIMFSDKIVVNKVDLVPASTAVEVFHRVRSINASAEIVSCSRGNLDPAELEGLGAFDRLMREAEAETAFDEQELRTHEQSHDHGDGGHHDHQHGHACEGGGDCSLEQGHEDLERPGEESSCSLDHDHGECGHSHSHSHRHNTQVGTFSVVKKTTEVLALPFARWVRTLAFLPKEKGTLFRSKAVLAVAGSDRKLVFHAVSDVMERREAGRWGPGEDRSCRIVFIGKRLDRAFLEDGFNSTCRVATTAPRKSPVAIDSTLLEAMAMPGVESLLEVLVARVPSAFYLAMAGLSTGEALGVGQTCSALLAAVEGGQASEHYQTLAKDGLICSTGFHLTRRRSSPAFYLHHMVSASTARSYATAAAGAKLEMTSSMGVGKTGLRYESADAIEAAGVSWLEVEELADQSAKNFAVEFSWRRETMEAFFASPGASTQSAMAKVEYEVEDEDAFDEEIDALKFWLVLRPETVENNQASSAAPVDAPAPPAATSSADLGGTTSTLPLHRLMIKTVGGRSCSQVYGLSFHSISPSFQVHVQVPDHRVPYFQTDQLFHKWHPLMEHLRKEPRLQFLVRMKPDGSGPLDNLCGCC